ncbi:hypothetical protein [Algoriphagus winogradskyi]|uniref:Uncharacterized protein n=1 Tax=Algoriphagus winogradskyi TaxID=237017 RepID=A0ABY1P4F5_9BACT|nr:hypothetical protein [Algoriphagus winogradskyi]SMP26254.1 hypothetical protein SAMN06265367_104343 [Algoriphagus winogradskyi]
MYKKLITYFLGLIWLVSLSAFLSFQPHSEYSKTGERRLVTVQESISPVVYYFGSNYSPKTPPFCIDWSVWSKFNSTWIPFEVEVGEAFLHSSFFKKSLPLFDVKETFIHFFYTW